MAFTLPNVRLAEITWSAADMAVEAGNDTSYGAVSINFTVQGPEDPNMVLSSTVTYWLPEDTPSYLVAYQRCYEYLKNSLNLSPDQLDQLEQWNQRIVGEVNTAWTKAGLTAPDLTANDWSMSAPFFTTYQNKTGVMTGQFDLILNTSGVVTEEPPISDSGF